MKHHRREELSEAILHAEVIKAADFGSPWTYYSAAPVTRLIPIGASIEKARARMDISGYYLHYYESNEEPDCVEDVYINYDKHSAGGIRSLGKLVIYYLCCERYAPRSFQDSFAKEVIQIILIHKAGRLIDIKVRSAAIGL
jgi:hypothetical protein